MNLTKLFKNGKIDGMRNKKNKKNKINNQIFLINFFLKWFCHINNLFPI